ncbi:MAG: hypothetical protein JSU70_09165 [Phycisphaerales bacterium]|nr:MAG: hypothetical protein JSU70_09165 [Phycisphaerales bacterium]
MKLDKRTPSGREKDKAAVKLLEKLREQLYSSNVSTVRQSAFNLSWLQEDGLDILKEALYGDAHRRTKNAAAYGLRKMRGRMKTLAAEVLQEGSEHTDRITAETCKNALLISKEKKVRQKPHSAKRKRAKKFDIKEISKKRGSRGQGRKLRRPVNHNRP